MGQDRATFHPDPSMGGAGAPGMRPGPGGMQPGVRPLGADGGAPRPGIAPPVQPVVPRTPGAGEEATPKIRALDQRLAGGGSRHEDNWKRTPNLTGTGAIHVKSFHCKLTGDSLDNLDRQINEWLDAHPQYEVKFATTTVGEWTGKLREPNLIVQLWM